MHALARAPSDPHLGHPSKIARDPSASPPASSVALKHSLRTLDYAEGSAALAPVQRQSAASGAKGGTGPERVSAQDARGLLGLAPDAKLDARQVTQLPEGKSRVVDRDANGQVAYRNFERDGAGQFAIAGEGDQHAIAYDDVKQGMADCFAMATIAAVARARPDQIMDMVRELGPGQYLVRFWAFDGDRRSPEWIPVTAAVPTRTVDGEQRPAFAHSDDAAGGQIETWPAVIEKAFAAFVETHQQKSQSGATRKGYQAIDYGSPLFAYQSIVGDKPAGGNTRGGTFASDAEDITGRTYHWEQQDWSEQFAGSPAEGSEADPSRAFAREFDAEGKADLGPAAAGWAAMWGALAGTTPVIASDAGGHHVVAVVELGPSQNAPWSERTVRVYDQMQGHDATLTWSLFSLKYERVILSDKAMPDLP